MGARPPTTQALQSDAQGLVPLNPGLAMMEASLEVISTLVAQSQPVQEV